MDNKDTEGVKGAPFHVDTNDLTQAATLVVLGWEAISFTPSTSNSNQVYVRLRTTSEDLGRRDIALFIAGDVRVEPGRYEQVRRELLRQIKNAIH